MGKCFLHFPQKQVFWLFLLIQTELIFDLLAHHQPLAVDPYQSSRSMLISSPRNGPTFDVSGHLGSVIGGAVVYYTVQV